MIENFTIFGERCSGTNFLQYAMEKNFNLDLTWKYCWKHEFGNQIDFRDSENTLFLCIYRNPVDWINSLYRKKYHVPNDLESIEDFLSKPMKMVNKEGKEIKNTRNIYTGNVYQTIFELRSVKLQFLLKDMPTKAKHVEIFSYEEFCSNYDKILKFLKRKYNLKSKGYDFPKPVTDIYRGGSIIKSKDFHYEKQIKKSKIIPFLDTSLEESAGYFF
jgi:hypothetical protein